MGRPIINSAALYECARAGLTRADAARKLGVSPISVYAAARRKGIKFALGKVGRRRRVATEQLLDCLRRGLTLKETSVALGVCYDVAAAAARREGVRFPKRSMATGALDKARADKMCDAYLAGRTLQSIGDEYGVSRERVRQIIKRHRGIVGLEVRHGHTPRVWREMQSAPKDGSRILATDGARTLVTLWGKVSHVPIYGWLDLDVPCDPEDIESWSPTHWMPLPAPPSEAA